MRYVTLAGLGILCPASWTSLCHGGRMTAGC
jgi:hypothetical protein